MNKSIKFNKGGGKNVVETDNLLSTDSVEILLGLGEGEIEGLEDGEKSFFLDNTPLVNQNGSNNFENFKLEIFPGSGVDEKVDFSLAGSSRTLSVGVELAQDVPVTRTTQASNIDFIELRLVISSLYHTYQGKKNSRVDGNTAVLKVEYKLADAEDWINVFPEDNLVISGKTTAAFYKEVRWPVKNVNGNRYDVRVTKLSKDDYQTESGSGRKNMYYSHISIESIQEINSDAREFPHTALAHLVAQADDQFSSVPEFSGIYKLKKIKVPSNYDPIAKTYEGAWDGTFKIAWSDNPAWCLYDMVMNDRYGVRAYSDVELDRWDTYEAGQWCDEMVSDGRGGKQARYTLNMLISDVRNGKAQINYVASTFNAVIYEEATGYLRLKIDKDQDAVMLFAPENVASGLFNYTFTDPENRFNEISVAFTNPEINWSADTRVISNIDEITRNGRVVDDFVAVGCIYEGEALRRAYYRMITALTEKLIVTFSTNRLAQALSVWDIILISDPTMGYAISGRIKSVSDDRLTVSLRDPIYLEPGIDYKIKFTMPYDNNIYEAELDPLTGSGSSYQLSLKEPLPDYIPELSVFSLYGSGSTGTPKPFRITNIKEDGPDQYEITAIEINRNKWRAADNLEFAGNDQYSGLPNVDDIPYPISVSFTEFYDPGRVEFSLIVGAELDTQSYPYYSGELVIYSREVGTDAWVKREVVNNNTIIGHPEGYFEFVVLPKNRFGNTPPFNGAPRYYYDVSNVSEPPADVKGFRADQTLEGAHLYWEPNADLDLIGYEIRSGDFWDTAELISTNITNNTLFVYIKDVEQHTYLIKAIDGLGNYSLNSASVTISAKIPENVPNFWVTTNTDYIRFDWEEVEGIDMNYIIKRGDSWESGVEVMRTKGNNATVLTPSGQNSYFAIKAESPTGLQSPSPRFARADLALNPNRNVVIEIDNGKEGFPGITYNFTPDPNLPEIMVMDDTAGFAEHYFPVHLLKDMRARNWLETQAVVFGRRLTWNDLHYRYSDAESHITWVNSTELGDAGSVKTVIMTKSSLPYTGKLGFTLRDTLKDMSEDIDATTANNVSYSICRMTNGLYIQDGTRVVWDKDVEVPEVFSLSFKVRVTETTPNSFYLVRLTNPQESEFMFLYILENILILTVSDGQSLQVPVKWIKDLDFLTVAIVQDTNKRTIFFQSDYSEYKQSVTIEAKPVGKFTNIILGV